MPTLRVGIFGLLLVLILVIVFALSSSSSVVPFEPTVGAALEGFVGETTGATGTTTGTTTTGTTTTGTAGTTTGTAGATAITGTAGTTGTTGTATGTATGTTGTATGTTGATGAITGTGPITGPSKVQVSDIGYDAIALNQKAQLLKDIQKIVHNEILASRSTDAAATPMGSSEGAAANAATTCTSQGAEYQAHSLPSKNTDMSKMIRKDAIPCWGCALDY